MLAKRIAEAHSKGLVADKHVSVSSVDVVSDLFNMSNALRNEREEIVQRNQQLQAATTQSHTAYMNHGVTMKYNDELDEVAQVKCCS